MLKLYIDRNNEKEYSKYINNEHELAIDDLNAYALNHLHALQIDRAPFVDDVLQTFASSTAS